MSAPVKDRIHLVQTNRAPQGRGTNTITISVDYPDSPLGNPHNLTQGSAWRLTNTNTGQYDQWLDEQLTNGNQRIRNTLNSMHLHLLAGGTLILSTRQPISSRSHAFSIKRRLIDSFSRKTNPAKPVLAPQPVALQHFTYAYDRYGIQNHRNYENLSVQSDTQNQKKRAENHTAFFPDPSTLPPETSSSTAERSQHTHQEYEGVPIYQEGPTYENGPNYD